MPVLNTGKSGGAFGHSGKLFLLSVCILVNYPCPSDNARESALLALIYSSEQGEALHSL